MKIPESEWKWFGWSGHFICGQWCRFHLCTQVGKYLISTVGQYVHPSKSGANERQDAEFLQSNPNGAEIGYDRFYETMVFRAQSRCTDPACKCGMPGTNGENLDFAGYKTAGDAAKGHMAMCRKWAKSSPKSRKEATNG